MERRICIPGNTSMFNKVLQECNQATFTGHCKNSVCLLSFYFVKGPRRSVNSLVIKGPLNYVCMNNQSDNQTTSIISQASIG